MMQTLIMSVSGKGNFNGNDILPYQDGGGENGTLIITYDSKKGGISSKDIDELITEVLK